MARRRVVLFGNGELAALNHHYLTNDSPYEVVAFTVDGSFIAEDKMLGLPIVPFEDVDLDFPPADFSFSLFAGFRDVNRFRAERFARAKSKGFDLISYVSSKAIVSAGATLGESCYVYESAIVQPFARVGNNVVISPASMVGHHAVVDDHSFIASRVTILGSASIGSHGVIGASATILDGVRLGSRCIVGAGVVMAGDAKDGEVYIGAQAERIPRTSDQFAPFLTWSADARRRSPGKPISQEQT